MLPRSWRKSFNSGIVKPTKKRFCTECTDKLPCNGCVIIKLKKIKNSELN